MPQLTEVSQSVPVSERDRLREEGLSVVEHHQHHNISATPGSFRSTTGRGGNSIRRKNPLLSSDPEWHVLAALPVGVSRRKGKYFPIL